MIRNLKKQFKVIMYELYNLGASHTVFSVISVRNDYSSNTDPGQAICGSVHNSLNIFQNEHLYDLVSTCMSTM